MARTINGFLKIHSTAEGAAIVLGNLTSLAHNLNTQVVNPETGDVFQQANVVTRQEPKISFGTLCLKTMLSTVATIGKCVASDGSHPGVVAYQQSLNNCNATARGSAGSHLSLTGGKGQLLIDQIEASRGGFATLTGTFYGLSADGTAAPFVIAYNANLPASPIVDELYSLGKPTVLGTQVDHVVSVGLQYNHAIELPDEAGTIWQTVLDVLKSPVSATIVTEDPTWLNPGTRLEYEGSQATHADTALWFLKHAYNEAAVSGGTFEDLEAEVHIKGTLQGLVHVSDHGSASGNAKGQTTIQILPIEAGGTAPLVWDTTAAYIAA